MKQLFFTLLFLTLCTFFLMRIHQSNFEAENGYKFNVMAFELPGSEENMNVLIKDWSEPEKKEFVLEQLRYDYFFMSALFPCILVLCIWALLKIIRLEKKTGKSRQFLFLKRMLLILALLQIFALAFDVSENLRLSAWIEQGYAGNMLMFETLVVLKFVFGITGFLVGFAALGVVYTKRKRLKSRKG